MTSWFLSLHRGTRFIIVFDIRCDSFFTWIFVRSFRHHFRTFDRTEMTNVIRSNNIQSRATLWVLETCLIVGLLLLMIILITASLSSNTYNKWNFLTRGLDIWKNNINVFHHIYFVRLVCLWLDPIVPERANHPISVQCPMRWFQILLNCEKQQFVSCTSNLLEQMYDFRKRIMFLQKWISNLQDLLRSQSLEVPVCIVWQHFPHDNGVCIHMCDEHEKTHDKFVCHKSKLLTNLPRISILLWHDVHECIELILCRVAESSCLPTHNIVPHISGLDLPYRRTMKINIDFSEHGNFSVPPAEIRDSNMIL